MTFHWPYYTLRSDGILVDDSGYVAFPVPRDEIAAPLLKSWGKKAIQSRPFANVGEAEAWLAAQDLRGNVRG